MQTTNDPQKISQSLNWIVSILNRHQIPYQIIGGLAAKAYGAKRPLVDIDLYAQLDEAQAALEEMKPNVIRNPSPYRSTSWDVTYMALDYCGVLIEIGDSSTNPRIYNQLGQCWEPLLFDFTKSTLMNLYDVEVTVMPKDELIRYKAMLNREVDLLDIQQITETAPSPE